MDFNILLQQAQKLTSETQSYDDLPSIERTLPQVLQATQELHSRVTQTGTQDIQAHILLGAKGIDLSKISQKLETLSARKTFDPLEPIVDTDVQNFLRNERENAILSVIEEVHKTSYATAQKQKWNNIFDEWKVEKVKLMNALIAPSQNWLDFRKNPEQTILNETTFGGRSCLNNQEMAYAKEVFEYNKLVIEGALRPNLVQKFAKVAESFNDSKISEMWELIKCMSNVPAMPKIHDPIKTRIQKNKFIDQAKRYLEGRYKVYISTVIAENLREAQRGGIPSTIKMVAAFLELKYGYRTDKLAAENQGHDEMLWGMVYYCLRCGDIQAALKCLEKVRPGHEDLIQALEERHQNPDQKMSSKLDLQIKMQYKRQIRNGPNSFKRVVYCIVACCDVTEQHLEVAKTSDDFLWIQLSLIRGEGSDSNDCLTYSNLQTMILEQYGEKHYNAETQPHLYFQVLILTGQIEAAIEFLSRFERYKTHAVHIALALNEMFLIGGPRNVQQPLLSVDIEDPQPMRRLNIARLVILYVKKFEITDPAEALQYFYFLRNLRDPENRNLFIVCVSDMAIECREYALLFGKIQSNGMRSRGLVDQFESIEVSVRSTCDIVAEDLVKKGMFEDAIKLFDLAENHEQALRYLSVLLSQVVHLQNKKGALRERLQIKAMEMTERYAGEELQCASGIITTFTLLRDLLIFFDLYHSKKYQPALEMVSKTRLVPLNIDELEPCVNNFKRLSGEVCRVFPDVLLATMDILYSQYKSIKGNDVTTFGDPTREGQITFLRNQAKVLTNMAATIPYRMPGDTNNRLVQTEILMH